MPTLTTPLQFREQRVQENQPSKTGPWLVQPGFDRLTTAGTSTKVTSSDPNWRQKVARKQDASQPYTLVKYTGRPSMVSCQTSAGPEAGGGYMNSRLIEISMTVLPAFNSSDDTTLRDQALARIKRKLAGNVIKKNVAVPILELRDLRRTVVSINGLLGETLKALIEIKRTKGRSAYKYAADKWLTFNFGVAPMLADITEINAAISHFLTKEDSSVVLRGGSSKTWLTQQSVSNQAGTYHYSLSRRIRVQHTLSYLYVGGFDLRLKSGNNYGALDTFGLTVKDLPSTAWELFPFSWVVDYFTTVGSYLEDTFEMPPGNLKYLVLCKRYTASADISSHLVQSVSGSQIDRFADTPGFLNVVVFTRSKLTSLPYRSLRFKTLNEIGGIGNLDRQRKDGEDLNIGAFNKLLNLASVLATGAKH